MFVQKVITITGETGEEVSQAARDQVSFLKQAGITVTGITAYGDFSFQGKVPLSFDEDEPQDVFLPIGRKLMRVGQDGGLPCEPTATTVVSIVTLAEGEEIEDVEDVVNMLDVLDKGGRKLARDEDETEEAAK